MRKVEVNDLLTNQSFSHCDQDKRNPKYMLLDEVLKFRASGHVRTFQEHINLQKCYLSVLCSLKTVKAEQVAKRFVLLMVPIQYRMQQQSDGFNGSAKIFWAKLMSCNSFL